MASEQEIVDFNFTQICFAMKSASMVEVLVALPPLIWWTNLCAGCFRCDVVVYMYIEGMQLKGLCSLHQYFHGEGMLVAKDKSKVHFYLSRKQTCQVTLTSRVRPAFWPVNQHSLAETLN